MHTTRAPHFICPARNEPGRRALQQTCVLHARRRPTSWPTRRSSDVVEAFLREVRGEEQQLDRGDTGGAESGRISSSGRRLLGGGLDAPITLVPRNDGQRSASARCSLSLDRTQYPTAYRDILVANGILNGDDTPNAATVLAQGWHLAEATP